MPKIKRTETDEATATSEPVVLSVKGFAHIARARLTLGDLTVVVGPQGSGKSLVLQWLKVALDGRHIVQALRSAGHPTDRVPVLIDLIFGTGMGPAWREGESRVDLDGGIVNPKTISRRGAQSERLFFVPAHRAMLISNGWAAPFQALTSETPAVARLFSQRLFERFSSRQTGTLFPVPGRLKAEIREKIDDAVFHGGRVGIEEDAQHALRLRLVHGSKRSGDRVHLPYMTWTAGQREFTPLLLGLYHLLPPSKQRKQEGIDWVVIEEPEMGLHPKAITSVMLLVLDLLWRGYRVVMSSHSPHVLTMLWMMRLLQTYRGRWQLVCDAFGVPYSQQMQRLAEAALRKDYRASLFDFGPDGRVTSLDISSLDPGAEDERIAGWGGLTSYASRFGEAVRTAANESEP